MTTSKGERCPRCGSKQRKRRRPVLMGQPTSIPPGSHPPPCRHEWHDEKGSS